MFWIEWRSGSVLSFVLFTGGILGVTFLKRKRQQHALAQTDRNDVLIAMSGSEQEKQALLQEVTQTFQRIQTAWDAGTLESAACWYTPRLYDDEHRRVLADNREKGPANHTQKVSLVRISNYRQLGIGTAFPLRLVFPVWITLRIKPGDRRRGCEA